jgi:hypothetical protein
MTFDTEKFLSSLPIFFLNSVFMLDMCTHFLALLNKFGSPSLQLLKSRVNETPFPSPFAHRELWDVQLFLVRLILISIMIMFDNGRIGRF